MSKSSGVQEVPVLLGYSAKSTGRPKTPVTSNSEGPHFARQIRYQKTQGLFQRTGTPQLRSLPYPYLPAPGPGVNTRKKK